MTEEILVCIKIFIPNRVLTWLRNEKLVFCENNWGAVIKLKKKRVLTGLRVFWRLLVELN